VRSPLHKLFRKAVFWAGDVRRLNTFSYVTWDAGDYLISLDEVIREAIPKLNMGDIILTRHKGYLSNLFIGGFMIHTGVYVGDGWVVEAISEGVVKHHVANILHADYAMILRPKFDTASETEDAIERAVYWAELAVGCEYDELFNFDVEREREALRKGQKKNIKLACTEVALLCYYDYVDKLGIKLRRNINLFTRVLGWLGLNVGEEVIDADVYVKANFDVIWKSKSITVEDALAHGCGPEYMAKLIRKG
jgi:uncharacterized protein YycO